MKPFISLCMIVKNEEKVLRRCLESINGLIDEIIIVDTGSTDNTKKIASEFDTFIYDYQWNNNFAAARNFAQSKATGKWILFLDADEYVDNENFRETIEKLKELDLSQNFDAYLVTQINFGGYYGESVNPCLTIRIYKNDPSIEFHRSIHEQLYRKNAELSVGLINFYIYHSGYLKNTHKEKNKTNRNVNLLLSELENNENAFDHYNMGNEFGIQGRIEEALESYQKAYMLKNDYNRIWVPNVAERIISCLLRLERTDEALKVVEDASLYWGNIADFKCLKGYIYMLLKRYEDAENELLELISNKNAFRASYSLNYIEYLPYKFLGEIYEERNEIEKAVKYFSHALNFNNRDLYTMEKLYNLLLKYEDKQNVATFIQNQDSLNNIINRFLLLKVLLDTGEIELVEHLIRNWSIDCPVGLSFKIHLLKDEYNSAFNILDQISIEELISEGWNDINDILILSLQLNNKNLDRDISERLLGSNDWLNIFFNDNQIRDVDITKKKLIILLQKCIKFRKFDLFELIVKKVSFLSLNVEIGNLLYKNKFKDLAIDFYQEVVFSQLDEQAFVNIIESFIENEHFEDSLRFAYMAIEYDQLDYRIFKMAVEILNRLEIHDDKEKLIDIALQHYPDSEYIKGFSHELNIPSTTKVLLKDNMHISVYLNDFIGKIITSTNDYYERLELDSFLRYIPKRSVIYDVGTNIGNHTIFFSQYANPCKIFAFEPIDSICKVLEQNVKDNNINNVEILNVAVGDKKAKGNMHLRKGNTGASHLSFNKNGNVDVVKLDDLKLTPPNFIKIDVENFEYEALVGMENTLLNFKPVIWIEIRDENLTQVNKKLNQLGYKLIDKIHSKYDYGNYIYVS